MGFNGSYRDKSWQATRGCVGPRILLGHIDARYADSAIKFCLKYHWTAKKIKLLLNCDIYVCDAFNKATGTRYGIGIMNGSMWNIQLLCAFISVINHRAISITTILLNSLLGFVLHWCNLLHWWWNIHCFISMQISSHLSTFTVRIEVIIMLQTWQSV